MFYRKRGTSNKTHDVTTSDGTASSELEHSMSLEHFMPQITMKLGDVGEYLTMGPDGTLMLDADQQVGKEETVYDTIP